MKKIIRTAIVCALAGAALLSTGCTKDYSQDLQSLDTKFTSQIADLKTQAANLEKTVADLQTAKASAESRISALETAKATAETMLAQLQQEKAAMQAAITTLQSNVSSLTASSEAAKKEIEKLTTSVAAAATKEELTKAVSEIDKDIASLNAQILTISDKIAGINTSIAKLESTVDAIKVDISGLKAADTEINNKIEGIKTTLANMYTKDQVYSKEVADKTFATLAAMTATNDALGKLAARVESAESSITSINTQIKNLVAADAELAGQVNTLQTTLGTVSSELLKLADRVLALEGKVSANESAILTNAAAILANSKLISANTAKLEEQAAQIGANATAISGNASNIAVNAAAITKAEQAIVKNAEDILANAGKIAENGRAIAANAEAIIGLRTYTDGEIAKINIAIGTINKTIGDIQADVLALQKDMTTAKADIIKAQTTASTALSNAQEVSDALDAFKEYVTKTYYTAKKVDELLLAQWEKTETALNSMSGKLAAEVAARENGDEELQTLIENSTSSLSQEDLAIRQLLATEKAERISADEAIKAAYDPRIKALSDSIATLYDKVAAFQAAYNQYVKDNNAAVAELKADLDAEVTARLALAGTVSGIDAAYKAADELLGQKIAAIEAAYQAADVAIEAAYKAADAAIEVAYKAADETLTGNISAIDVAYQAADAAINAAYQAADVELGKRIDSVKTDAAGNLARVIALEAGLNIANENIKTNKTAIEKNAQEIAANLQKIQKNVSDIATNAANINTNALNIAANKTAIEKNAQEIAANLQKINVLADSASKHYERIQELDAKYEALKGEFDTFKNDIEPRLDAAESAIGAQQTALAEQGEALAALAAKVGADSLAIVAQIKELDTKVEGYYAELTTSIAETASELNGKISAAEARIKNLEEKEIGSSASVAAIAARITSMTPSPATTPEFSKFYFNLFHRGKPSGQVQSLVFHAEFDIRPVAAAEALVKTPEKLKLLVKDGLTKSAGELLDTAFAVTSVRATDVPGRVVVKAFATSIMNDLKAVNQREKADFTSYFALAFNGADDYGKNYEVISDYVKASYDETNVARWLYVVDKAGNKITEDSTFRYKVPFNSEKKGQSSYKQLFPEIELVAFPHDNDSAKYVSLPVFAKEFFGDVLPEKSLVDSIKCSVAYKTVRGVKVDSLAKDRIIPVFGASCQIPVDSIDVAEKVVVDSVVVSIENIAFFQNNLPNVPKFTGIYVVGKNQEDVTLPDMNIKWNYLTYTAVSVLGDSVDKFEWDARYTSPMLGAQYKYAYKNQITSPKQPTAIKMMDGKNEVPYLATYAGPKKNGYQTSFCDSTVVIDYIHFLADAKKYDFSFSIEDDKNEYNFAGKVNVDGKPAAKNINWYFGSLDCYMSKDLSIAGHFVKDNNNGILPLADLPLYFGDLADKFCDTAKVYQTLSDATVIVDSVYRTDRINNKIKYAHTAASEYKINLIPSYKKGVLTDNSKVIVPSKYVEYGASYVMYAHVVAFGRTYNLTYSFKTKDIGFRLNWTPYVQNDSIEVRGNFIDKQYTLNDMYFSKYMRILGTVPANEQGKVSVKFITELPASEKAIFGKTATGKVAFVDPTDGMVPVDTYNQKTVEGTESTLKLESKLVWGTYMGLAQTLKAQLYVDGRPVPGMIGTVTVFTKKPITFASAGPASATRYAAEELPISVWSNCVVYGVEEGNYVTTRNLINKDGSWNTSYGYQTVFKYKVKTDCTLNGEPYTLTAADYAFDYDKGVFTVKKDNAVGNLVVDIDVTVQYYLDYNHVKQETMTRTITITQAEKPKK